MSFGLFIRLLFFALAVGFAWLGYVRVYDLQIPFWASGILTGVWFLPAIVAASVQSRAGLQRPGWIFSCETVAALVSATLGPMGWVSLQFGVAQGLAGEVGFRLYPGALAAALGAGIADLVLLALHPAGFAVAQSTSAWIGHAAGVLFSAALLAKFVDIVVKKVVRS